MIPGKKYTAEDVLAILWRRKLWIAIPTIAAALATVAFTRTLPDMYKSETLVTVQPPQVREDLVKSTPQSSAEDRIQAITQQVLSRTRLEAIVTDLDLYEEERRTGLMEDVVEVMRSNVGITVVRGDAFRVSFVSTNPITAMKVTERLARLFIDENLRDREMLAEGTNQFLTSQLDDARRRLVEQEKRLEGYRLKHSGELPSQQQSNIAALNNVQLQVQSLIDSRARDQDKLQLVDRQIADLNTPDPEVDPIVDAGNGTVTGGTTAQQLAAAQAILSQLQLRLKPEHPDVARMKRVVKDLEAKADREAKEQPLTPDEHAPKSPAELTRLGRLKRLREMADALNKTIGEKEEEEKRLRALGAQYQSRAEAAPTRETELIELMRDYDTLQKLYSGLLAKKEESKLAVNLETRQIGEQFRILDPARVPQRPFSPNRGRLNSMGGLGGLALGLGFVFLLEWRDTTLKTDEDVRVAARLPVIALIPQIVTHADRVRDRRWRLIAGAVTVLAMMAVAAAAFWVLRA